MDTTEIADAAQALRASTVTLLRGLSDEELQVEATPGWTVADVFRHLAASDRDVVLGKQAMSFLPFVSDEQFERRNDRAIERLRRAPRQQLEDELERWGARLQWLIRHAPQLLARVHVPTLFGKVPLAWLSALRIYDEWVHQHDVMQALERGEPPMDDQLRELLAQFQLRALPAKPLRQLQQRRGVVEVEFTDVAAPSWRFDLWNRTFGANVQADPSIVVRTDVPTWTLIAADRISWEAAEGDGHLQVHGEDRAAAATLLGAVRVV